MPNVKITDFTGNVTNLLVQKSNVFLRTACDEVVKISTPNTPKKTGRLRMDVVKQVLGLKGKISWGKNYAIFQESKQFKKYTTPGTGPNFAGNAINAMVKISGKIMRTVGLIK
jgi:hypothetical protein